MNSRRVRSALICVAIGVLITYITAIIGQFESRRTSEEGIESDPPPSLRSPLHMLPWSCEYISGVAFERWGIYYPGAYARSWRPKTTTVPLAVPTWVNTPGGRQFEAMGTPYCITTTAAGWPLSCLRFSTWDSQTYPNGIVSKSTRVYTPQIAGGISLSSSPGDGFVLPFSPIWSGLLLNAACYAGAVGASWWVLVNRRARAEHAKAESLKS